MRVLEERKNMRTYTISKNEEFLVYGAAYKGKSIKANLEKQGYKVDAFLDKRALLLNEVEGIPVVHPEEVAEPLKEKIVVVAITNPLEQRSVANYLISLDMHRIIYATESNKYSLSASQKTMNELYYRVCSGMEIQGSNVYYAEDIQDDRFDDLAFINEAGGVVTAYIPIDIIFTISRDRELPIFYDQVELINYCRAIEGEIDNVIDAINDYSRKHISDKSFTEFFEENRQGISDKIAFIYTQMNLFNQRLSYGMDYFVDNAVSLAWNENGYFTLKNNILQVVFFIVKGLPRIPARISVADYSKWLNQKELEKCIEFASTTNLDASYTLLEHPNFFNFPSYRDITGKTRIMRILEHFSKENIEVEGKKVIDIGSYYGFYSRYFARMGADVTSVEFNGVSYEFQKRLNKLMHCGDIETLNQGAETLERPEEFDISIMLTVLYWHLDIPLGKELLKAVDSMTKKYLIWESGGEPEREKLFIFENSSFSKYTKIGETVGSGLCRELGIFEKCDCNEIC